MGITPDDAAAAAEAARGLLATADRIHEAVARAQTALEGVAYQCDAASRQRDRMALLAGRVHHHGNAMAEAGALLIRQATSLELASGT